MLPYVFVSCTTPRIVPFPDRNQNIVVNVVPFVGAWDLMGVPFMNECGVDEEQYFMFFFDQKGHIAMLSITGYGQRLTCCLPY